ncbi:putative receptor-like protein kinase [Acorus calamus]|uniref:Receptor-like protein kinase n=1 Tax=Acorus calamus TaxID=4465 RepID=A0AAV9EUG1_ACOCL|nr:putative receptor-like protein kinase [Acorus calamus]KAK1316574.1 putative receptor-like protein kinase [Acorus calamus]
MKRLSSLSIPIWVLSFSHFYNPNNARHPPFLSLSPSPSPSLLPQSHDSHQAEAPQGMWVGNDEHHHHLNKDTALTTILATAGFCIVLSSLICIWIYCQKNRRSESDTKSTQKSDVSRSLALVPILGKFNSLRVTDKKGPVSVVEYSLLEVATGKFNDSNILGEGGFGCVYKARFDEGTLAAVKRLECNGIDCEREFQNEVDLLSRIRHPNIVTLSGYCIHGQMRFIVYELMQNGSLEMQLHGPTHGSSLSWHLRMKIALDTARGLEFLHEHCNPPVIHRDLKSSNILLDSSFSAKIADFGLAVTDGNQGRGDVKLSGTLGYVAPEYLLDGELTEKSDVYAFGVVLLELLLGRKPVEKTAPGQCQSIVTWAIPQLTDRAKLPNIVDPVIRNTMNLKHLYQVAAVAVLCVQPEPSYRPLITDVLHSLIPLVPIELGGSLRVAESTPQASHESSNL